MHILCFARERIPNKQPDYILILTKRIWCCDTHVYGHIMQQRVCDISEAITVHEKLRKRNFRQDHEPIIAMD